MKFTNEAEFDEVAKTITFKLTDQEYTTLKQVEFKGIGYFLRFNGSKLCQ